MQHNIQYTSLFNQILREYNLELKGKFVPSARNPERQVWEGFFSLTPLKGGALLTGILSKSQTLESQVCETVAKARPESEFAGSYTRITYSTMVSRIQSKDNLESLGYLGHVALRKYCDSRGSALWWNLLSRLDEKRAFGLFHRALTAGYNKAFRIGSTAEEKPERQEVRMGILIASTREALDSMFSCYSLFSSLSASSYNSREARAELIKDYGFTEEHLESLTGRDLEELSRVTRYLLTSLDCLSNSDLESIWYAALDEAEKAA